MPSSNPRHGALPTRAPAQAQLRSPLAALLLLAALPWIGACGGGDSAAGDGATRGAARGPASPLYMRGACHTCHGPELLGTQLGPALVDLEKHWDEAGLVQYLLDPQGVTDRTPRLRERRAHYIMRMPPATQAGLSREDVRELAEWLLEDGRRP